MMSSVITFIGMVVFIGILIFTSRVFYLMELKRFTRKMTRQLGLDILDLSYSFDQMVYVVSLPSSIENIKNANKNDLLIELEYTSYFFPELIGIKIYLEIDHGKQTIAYLPIKSFRLPKLDELLEQGKINEADYLKISTFKLIHETTLNDISEEVYKQLMYNKNIG
jgi:hypothetical protein